MMTGKGNCLHLTNSLSSSTTNCEETTTQNSSGTIPTNNNNTNSSTVVTPSSASNKNTNSFSPSSSSTTASKNSPESEKIQSSIHHSYMEGALIFIANSNTTSTTTTTAAAAAASGNSNKVSSAQYCSTRSSSQQASSKLSTSTTMVKEKPNSTRIYDEDGYRQRAACICVKNESESEVLMVSSSRNSDQWIFPGGGLEPDETATMAAIREVIEEAGVRGKLDRCLGTFENQERRHRTAVYVMIVTEELAEWDDARNIGRKRKWFSLDEAVEQLALHKPSHLNYLNHFRASSKMTLETDNGAEPT